MAKYIGIAGTHSTGKSTYVEELKKEAEKRGISCAVIANSATRCQEEGFPILKDHTFESTLWIMTSVIKAELEAGLRNDLVIIDRPVHDAIGYLEAALEATSRSIKPDKLSYLYNLAKMHSPEYNVLFRTRLDETIPLGEGRDPDMEFRKLADKTIKSVFNRIKVQHKHPLEHTASEILDLVFS